MSKHGKHLIITPNWQNSALSYDLKIQKMGHHLFFNIHFQTDSFDNTSKNFASKLNCTKHFLRFKKFIIMSEVSNMKP